jgi:hypothetical protein
MNNGQPRYDVEQVSVGTLKVYNIYDAVNHRVPASCWFLSDAEGIAALLNGSVRPQMNPRLRPLLATRLYDFRLWLELENGGPLHDPDLALFLDDLCDFLQFNTGERALVMGRELLAVVAQIDPVEEVPIPIVNELIIIQQ